MLVASLFCFTLSAPLLGGEATAFDVAREGNRFVGEQSKDKIVQIRSEKSIGSVTPDTWYVVYRDPDATFKTVEVKFGKGRKLDVSHPWRMIKAVTGENKVLNRDKMKVDSDQAIKIATSEPALKDLKLLATKLELEDSDEGFPVWKVTLWAKKFSEPSRDVEVGKVWVSAKDGKVVKTSLNPKRAK